MTSTDAGDDRNVYLDDQGNYRDNTPANRDAYPPAGTPADAEPVPFTEDGEIDGEQMVEGTEAGDPATGLPPADDAKPSAKTRKQ